MTWRSVSDIVARARAASHGARGRVRDPGRRLPEHRSRSRRASRGRRVVARPGEPTLPRRMVRGRRPAARVVDRAMPRDRRNHVARSCARGRPRTVPQREKVSHHILRDRPVADERNAVAKQPRHAGRTPRRPRHPSRDPTDERGVVQYPADPVTPMDTSVAAAVSVSTPPPLACRRRERPGGAVGLRHVIPDPPTRRRGGSGSRSSRSTRGRDRPRSGRPKTIDPRETDHLVVRVRVGRGRHPGRWTRSRRRASARSASASGPLMSRDRDADDAADDVRDARGAEEDLAHR
jgi:hypothetical protein